MKKILTLILVFLFHLNIFCQCPGLTFSINPINVSCNGFSDGELEYSINGTGNYFYFVSDSSSQYFFDNWDSTLHYIFPGNFHFVIFDSDNGCYDSLPFSINEPDELILTVDSVKNTSCFDSNDGIIYSSISGGTPPYNIMWEDGLSQNIQYTQTVTNLSWNIYYATVSDSNSCVANGTGFIDHPMYIDNYFSYNNASCGNCDGFINTNLTGGVPPYQYSWSSGLPPVNNQTNVCSGNYIMNVTDSLGCTFADTVTIYELGNININLLGGTGSACDVCSGTIMMTATGSNGPFNYEIPGYPIQSNGNFSGICAGYYQAMVFDTLGCVEFSNFMLGTADIPGLNLTASINNESGYGMLDGIIDLNLNGYIGNLQFEWSNGSTAEDLYSLPGGNYEVTITDSLGYCQTEYFSVNTYFNLGFIQGRIYNDLDSNCSIDSSGQMISNFLIRAISGNDTIVGISNNYGFYNIIVPSGNYIVEPVNTNLINTNCGLLYSIFVNDSSFIDNIDFYLIQENSFDVCVSGWATNMVPGFNGSYYIAIQNNGNIMTEAEVCLVFPSELTYLASSTIPSSISGDTICFNIPLLYAGMSQTVIIDFNTPAALSLGTNITSCIFSELIGAVDQDSLCDDYCFTQIVNGSYDPNDKSVSPVGVNVTGDILLYEEIFNYLIRFQNTGTGPAVNVSITDTLDAMLDPLSFEMLNASHNYDVEFINGNIIRWRFENIMLPDSGSDEPGSHGHVQFRIKTLNTPMVGQDIENTANIYFDFNEPVITNTTLNTYVSPNGIEIFEMNDVMIYPNPADERLFIQSKYAGTYSVLDLTGKEIMQQNILSLNTSFDIQNLAPGVYFVRSVTEQGTTTIKFIKK